MSTKIFIFLLLLTCLASCDTTKQYDVYAINHTSSELQVIYESGEETQSVKLAPQERLRIISTDFIESDQIRTSAEDCRLVAKDIKAVNTVGKESSLTWCSPDVAFSVVDIGQGEFTLIYTNEHF